MSLLSFTSRRFRSCAAATRRRDEPGRDSGNQRCTGRTTRADLNCRPQPDSPTTPGVLSGGMPFAPSRRTTGNGWGAIRRSVDTRGMRGLSVNDQTAGLARAVSRCQRNRPHVSVRLDSPSGCGSGRGRNRGRRRLPPERPQRGPNQRHAELAGLRHRQNQCRPLAGQAHDLREIGARERVDPHRAQLIGPLDEEPVAPG
jgi:hypothetical protein